MPAPVPGLDTPPLDPRIAIENFSSFFGARTASGTWSRSATTGTHSVSGVGFRPKAVLVMSRFDSSVAYAHSLAFAASGGTYAISQTSSGGIDPGNFLVCLTAGSSVVRGGFDSFDADGFTLSYSSASSASTSYYLCIG